LHECRDAPDSAGRRGNRGRPDSRTARRIVSSSPLFETDKALRCVHGELRDARGDVIDDPVVVLHDDALTVDINLHGGAWVVASTLELLRQSGFDVVESALDLLDGETILDREMHAALPRARTEEGVRMLLAQPAAWREFLAGRPSQQDVRRVLDDRCLSHLLDPPRVAIVGPPNVGKSTLANQLFGQRRSITADLPGTTRDWVGEVANIDGCRRACRHAGPARTPINEARRSIARGSHRQRDLIVSGLRTGGTPGVIRANPRVQQGDLDAADDDDSGVC
jgi:hypothetical protein